jgi:predicted nucleotide-binding protein (sugar kinase/HSP70/actin superfamily)
MDKVRNSLPRFELRRVMKRFLQDKNRGISMPLFADLAGISLSHLKDVFLYETEPLTEYVQRRVSKAYTEWKDGEVAIMQNRDNTRFVQYRKEARPTLKRTTGLQLVNGEIKIKVGITNRYDYSDLTLDEQLKGR